MRKILDFIKNNKKYLILGGAILLVIGLGFVIFELFYNDGMNNKNIYKVKYRVYQNGKWSRFSKNGMTIGDKEHPIQNLEFKYNADKGLIHYHIYVEDWTDQIYNPLEEIPEKIYGIKICDSNVLYKKYKICYRTYNKKDKWLNWACNSEMSGNAEEPITAIEIKLIPTRADKKEYLRDYDEALAPSKGL